VFRLVWLAVRLFWIWRHNRIYWRHNRLHHENRGNYGSDQKSVYTAARRDHTVSRVVVGYVPVRKHEFSRVVESSAVPLSVPMVHEITRLPSEIPSEQYFFPEDDVGLIPKRGCLLTLAYYAFPRWYEFGERRWSDIDRGNRRTPRKTCPGATFFTINPTWVDLGANPGLRGERPATNRLSHGTAQRAVFDHNISAVWCKFICAGRAWIVV
jgi:hypothetical protein